MILFSQAGLVFASLPAVGIDVRIILWKTEIIFRSKRFNSVDGAEYFPYLLLGVQTEGIG